MQHRTSRAHFLRQVVDLLAPLSALPPTGWFDPLVPTQSFDAYPVRVQWWAEDRSPEQRYCVSLVPRDGSPDRVLVDELGRVLAQPNLEAARTRARELGHDLVLDRPGPADVDLFGARSRISARPDEGDCAVIDDAWNLLVKVCRSTGQVMDFHGEDARRAGEKILWGTGVLRPPTERQRRPRLSRRERRKLDQVLARGVARFAAVIGSTRDLRFERITAAVNAEDPAGLIGSGCSSYEYSPEVDDLCALTSAATSEDVLAVFDRWFDDAHHLDRPAAERIAETVRQA